MILCEFELKVDVKTEARPGPDGAQEKKEPPKNSKDEEPKGKGKGKGKGEKGEYTSWNDPAIKNMDGSQKNLTRHEKKELNRIMITRSELPSKGKGKGKGDNKGKYNASDCNNWKKDEGCSYGASCIFAHGPPSAGRCTICNSKLHIAKDCTRPKEPRAKSAAQPKVSSDKPHVSASDASHIQELTIEEKELKELMSKLQGDDTTKGESLKMLMDAYKKTMSTLNPRVA